MEGASVDASGAYIALARWKNDFSRAFQYYLDRSTPHRVGRWLGTLAVALIYLLRVYLLQGFYIVTYGLGIYLLNLLIGFLSPIVDPEVEGLDGASLPTRGSDEFKPFIRRLPEFKFWKMQTSSSVKILVHVLGGTLLVDGIAGDGHAVTFLFQMRYSITKAICIAFVMSFFSFFDVPVFWPILLFYWIVLFFLTMKRQIMHMIKYKYIPFNTGKQKYTGKKASAISSVARD